MHCKSIVLVVIAILHYKFFSQGKSAPQILFVFLMLRRFAMHLYECDTFAQDILFALLKMSLSFSVPDEDVLLFSPFVYEL